MTCSSNIDHISTPESSQKVAIPELLAPAGDREALLAAIGAGADAIYLGLDQFNARQSAANFSIESLGDICALAHAHNVRIYVAVNVVILPHEMDDALNLVGKAWAAGIDAVIVQDIGLLSVLRGKLPQVRIHASTQINAHDSATVRALADMGVSRVTLARETNASEIEILSAVAREAGVEIESFVHGAICVCYSGQCLLSSLIGRRSANRGQCAQPCRLPYELIDKKGEVLETEGRHLLSPKDMAGIEHLPSYVASGVASLKIEGRMKSPVYVAAVVSTYRAALDLIAEGKTIESEEAFDTLTEAFNRGFTDGYFKGDSGNELMSYARPNNRGVHVGRIVGFDGSRAVVVLDKAIDAEDTIEIWTNKGRFAQPVGRMIVSGTEQESAPEGARIAIILDKRAYEGDRVFRVRNAKLGFAADDAIERATAEKLALDFTAHLVVGEPATLTVSGIHGGKTISVTTEGPIVEPARTRPLIADDVQAHINRLGGTPYQLGAFEIEMSDNAGMGFSTIHALRRDAIDAWELQAYLNGVPRTYEVQYITDAPAHKVTESGLEVVATVATMGAARAALNGGASQAHIAAYFIDDEDEPHPGVVPVLPRICRDSELETYLGIAFRFGGAVCSTLGQLAMCKQRNIPAQAHWSLNVTNPQSAQALKELGATMIWLSPELSGRQIAEIAQRVSIPVGIAVAGLTEVMVTEHCVLTAMGPCSHRCRSCKRREETIALRDRKGYCFPVKTDPKGRTHLYNSVPLDLTEALPEILESGVSAIRLDLETALTAAVAGEVARIRHSVLDTIAGRELVGLNSVITRGHYYRGIV